MTKRIIITLAILGSIVLGLMIGKAAMADISIPAHRTAVAGMEHMSQYVASIPVERLNHGRINE